MTRRSRAGTAFNGYNRTNFKSELRTILWQMGSSTELGLQVIIFYDKYVFCGHFFCIFEKLFLIEIFSTQSHIFSCFRRLDIYTLNMSCSVSKLSSRILSLIGLRWTCVPPTFWINFVFLKKTIRLFNWGSLNGETTKYPTG